MKNVTDWLESLPAAYSLSGVRLEHSRRVQSGDILEIQLDALKECQQIAQRHSSENPTYGPNATERITDLITRLEALAPLP